MNNLHDSNVLLPPDANATSTLEVVVVHDNVNGQVKSNWDPRNGSVSDKLSVAEKSGGTMMIGMEEGYDCQCRFPGSVKTNLLKGFFLRTMNAVPPSSTNRDKMLIKPQKAARDVCLSLETE